MTAQEVKDYIEKELKGAKACKYSEPDFVMARCLGVVLFASNYIELAEDRRELTEWWDYEMRDKFEEFKKERKNAGLN